MTTSPSPVRPRLTRPLCLVASMQCPDPRCQKRVYDFDPEVFRGAIRCARPKCGRRWWAMRLHPGGVLPQLAAVFGEELALDLFGLYGFPDSIAAPMFWQLSLSGTEYAASHGQPASTVVRGVLARPSRAA